MGNQNIFLKLLSSESGLTLKEIEPKAIGLSEWMDYQTHKITKMAFAATVIGDSFAGGRFVKDGERVNFRADMTLPMGNDCIALVRDGWLPAIFVTQGSQLLLDRNMVTKFAKRFDSEGISEGDHSKQGFGDFINHFNLECVINVSAFALEGNKRRHQTMEEVIEQLSEVQGKIQTALTRCKIQPENHESVNDLLAFMADCRDNFERGAVFLQKISPSLMQTLSGEKRRGRWDFILSKAQECGLKKTDLLVFAALSAASCAQGLNPAKRIIKPGHDYTLENAYNAMADFQLLEIFMYTICKYPDEKFVLLTDDRHLAKFWMGLIFREASGKNGGCEATFGIDEKILPLDESDLDYLRGSLDNAFRASGD